MNPDEHPARAGSSGERGTSGIAETLRQEANRAREAAARSSRRLGARARAELALLAERQKAGIAAAVAGVARHVRSLSGELAEQPNLSAIADQAADSVEDAAVALERQSLSELYDGAEDVCRRHPVAVATGAAVLGVLVSRLIMNSGRRQA